MSVNRGGRPRKLDIDLTPESLGSVLKNVWNELEENKRMALDQFKKQSRALHEITDQAMIGKINVDYLKLASDQSVKKIEIAKIIQTYVQKDVKSDSSANSEGSGKISADNKSAIKAMLADMKKTASETPEDEDVPTPDEIQENEDVEIKKITDGGNDDITEAGF